MSLDGTTVQVGDGRRAAAPPRTPALTMLFHPDPRRIGEVARLGSGAALSRSEPVFAAPGGHSARPLLDQAVSRRPLRLERVGDALYRVAPAPGGSDVRVDGAPLAGPIELGASALTRGVVLELNRRVVLLWHLLGPPRPRGSDLGLVGRSDAIEELRADIARVADLPHSVLITGESGTGKELVAQAIHRASDRRGGPCVCVNMAAVPPQTAASALFGHVRGAFTGAAGARAGFFAEADGGTLFLDEIGDAPLDVQPMLLRALETGEIRPLGSDAPREVDVRLIAATDADLNRAVEDGHFRQPLRFRLSGVELMVPPLRDRRDDIGRLLIHFLRAELDTIGELHRLAPPEAVAQTWLPAALVAELARFSWPGNVRQLRNVARQLAVANRGVDAFRVPPALDRALAQERERAAPAPASEPERRSPGEITEDALIEALRRCRWRPSHAANALGISRTALYGLMNKSDRIRKARDLSQAEIEACAEACMDDIDAMAERLEVSKRGLQLRMTELGVE